MRFKVLKPNSSDFLEFDAELSDFNSKKVIYHKPEVWRLWIQIGEWRVNLHKIFKSDTPELFHPHPWPMITSILKGSCEVGFGYGNTSPSLSSACVFSPGSSYTMNDPWLWHYVSPLSENILTIMVTGKPWETKADFNIHPASPQPELNEKEKQELWNEITLLLKK